MIDEPVAELAVAQDQAALAKQRDLRADGVVRETARAKQDFDLRREVRSQSSFFVALNSPANASERCDTGPRSKAFRTSS